MTKYFHGYLIIYGAKTEMEDCMDGEHQKWMFRPDFVSELIGRAA